MQHVDEFFMLMYLHSTADCGGLGGDDGIPSSVNGLPFIENASILPILLTLQTLRTVFAIAVDGNLSDGQ